MVDELGRRGYPLSAGTPLSHPEHGMERQGYLRSRQTLSGGPESTRLRCQSNHGTGSRIFGQLFRQIVSPAMSGPVLSSASGQSVWGSATGALFSWEPFDFGLRHASVVGAEAALTQARAGETLTRLDVQNAVAAAFLGVVAAQRAVTAAQADLERRNVLLQSVQTLVTNQLRP